MPFLSSAMAIVSPRNGCPQAADAARSTAIPAIRGMRDIIGLKLYQQADDGLVNSGCRAATDPLELCRLLPPPRRPRFWWPSRAGQLHAQRSRRTALRLFTAMVDAMRM